MGWGLEVPDGWTRGEPVIFFGGGPRYACSRDALAHPVGTFGKDEIAITFDSKAEAEAFRDWWRAPQTTAHTDEG